MSDTQQNQPMDVDSAAEALMGKIEQAPEQTEEQPEQGHVAEASEDTPQDDQADQDEQEEGAEDEAEQPEKPQAKLIPDDTPVTVKVNGEEKEVTIGELRKGYMMASDYTRKTQEVAEARKQFHAQAQQYEAAIQQRIDEVGFLAQTFMQQLVEAEGSTDWNALRQQNPAEYAARQQDMQQRRALLQRAFAVHQQAQQHQAMLRQATYQQTLAEQQEALSSLIPEWLDEKVAAKEKSELAKYLVDNGVPEQEVASLSNAVTVAISRKAMLYDRLQAAKKAVDAKKDKPVPKFTKPGPRDPNANKTTQQKLTDRARKTGSVDDFAAALAAKYG